MANWVYVENGQIKELYDILPKNWKYISGLRNSENDINFLKSIGWHKVVKQHQEYDINIYNIHSYSHNYIEETVVETLNLLEKNPAPQVSFEELKSKLLVELRAERNKRLVESDWTQVLDSPVRNRESWSVYRQQLRDLPAAYMENQVVNIENVEWPVVVDTGV